MCVGESLTPTLFLPLDREGKNGIILRSNIPFSFPGKFLCFCRIFPLREILVFSQDFPCNREGKFLCAFTGFSL